MEQGSILDTNVVIYYLEGALSKSGLSAVAQAISGGPKISVISKIELLCWRAPAGSNINKVRSFVSDSIIFDLDNAIVEKTIRLRKGHRKIKLPDAIIAATALHLKFNPVTRNTSDFSSIGGLKIIDPFNL